MAPGRRRIAVVGGGWAGLSAAVEAQRLGHAITLFEMAPQLGGRARSVHSASQTLDNGQHILIGAYVATLAMLRTIGVDTEAAFLRTPLRLGTADGAGLFLEPGPALGAFARAVWRRRGWTRWQRCALLATAARWTTRGFRCDQKLTVAALTARLPTAVRVGLIDPLCVAALNTPSDAASASVFLRVLKDALFSGPGCADLMLPRVGLSELVAEPARHMLEAGGAEVRLGQRVQALRVDAEGWRIDAEHFDAVVLAAAPPESARLAKDIAPEWSTAAAALRYEPIVTVYVDGGGAQLPEPMLMLSTDAHGPAQFVFDRGQLGGPPGQLAFVISGAQPWVDRGMEVTTEAVLRQALAELGTWLGAAPAAIQTLTEKRATFRCTPGLRRPGMQIAPGLFAAGDHVLGPYPATLEGAVRSGVAAGRAAGGVNAAQTARPEVRR
jgi:squalene-associated FAD-dependent desaturase